MTGLVKATRKSVMSMRREIISRTIAGVLAAILAAVFWYFWDLIWPAVVIGIKSGAIWVFSSTSIPRWLYLALVISFVVMLWDKVRSWIEANREIPTAPWYFGFTEFDRWGIKWRWNWRGEYPVNVNGYCPKCDRQIRHDEDRTMVIGRPRPTILFCTECKDVHVERPGRYPKIIDDVALEIEHTVRLEERRRNDEKQSN
jgi:hypothetical protein